MSMWDAIRKAAGLLLSVSPAYTSAAVLVYGASVIVAGLRPRVVRGRLARLRTHLAGLRLPARSFLGALLCSLLLWGMDVLRIALVARALDVPLGAGQVIPLSLLSVLGGLLPSIGGVGVI